MRKWEDISEGEVVLLGFVQVDIAGHSKLAANDQALKEAKGIFHRQMAGCAASRGGMEFSWAGDGGSFMFRLGSGEGFDDLVFSAIQMQNSMSAVNAEIDARTDLNLPLQIRVSCGAGQVTYSQTKGEITGDFLNEFLKYERELSQPGAVTVTNWVWKQLRTKLRERFTPFRKPEHLNWDLYIYGGETVGLDERNSVPQEVSAARLQANSGATPPQPATGEEHFYRFTKLSADPPKQICLIGGDLMQVTTADIWVNSENTDMEMARFSDKSISSLIRYHGAVKNEAGIVVGDVIAQELRWKAGVMAKVPAGSIVVTGSGELAGESTNNVKLIFHAAAVIAQEPGRGYRPIDDVGVCVRNALRIADDPKFKEAGLKSILFPLLGTGTAEGDLGKNAEQLIAAAVNYIQAHPHSPIHTIYFVAYSKTELAVCQAILQKQAALVAVDASQARTAGKS